MCKKKMEGQKKKHSTLYYKKKAFTKIHKTKLTILNLKVLTQHLISLTYHLNATLMGVVRQEVKRSAGKSGFMGKCSVDPQAASKILFFMVDGALCSGLTCPEDFKQKFKNLSPIITFEAYINYYNVTVVN